MTYYHGQRTAGRPNLVSRGLLCLDPGMLLGLLARDERDEQPQLGLP